MKKVWKYILSILLIIILATAGTVYYFLNIKTYDTTDEKIEEIIDSEYDIVLPDENSSNNNNVNQSASSENNKGSSTDSESNSNSVDTNNDDSSAVSNETSESEKKGSNGTSNLSTSESPSKSSTSTSNEEITEVTVKNIKDKYRPVFKSLESQANEKIDALVSRAIGEYQDKKGNDESISYSYFYQKYTSAGRDLENNTDEAFNYIYSALENDLKNNGYSASHAKVFKEQYEETKKARESALLNKAKESL